jgi:hypothetical protein
MVVIAYGRGSQTVGRSLEGAVGPLGWERVFFLSDIFILNKIQAQGKIFIVVGN